MDWHTRYQQQAAWTASLRAYLLALAGHATARRILDVGCGTGALLEQAGSGGTGALIEERAASGVLIEERAAAGSPYRYGLDIDRANLRQAAAHAPAAPLVQADAHRLPYPANTFDIAWCHFVFLWLADPDTAASEMARVVRPGGAVIALAEPDYGGRIDYPPALEALGRAQSASLQAQGADPTIGRRLGSIFQRAGLTRLEVGVLGGQWRHALAAAPTSGEASQEWELEWAVLENDLNNADFRSHKDFGSLDLQTLKQLDLDSRQSGERLLFVPTFYAIGWKADSSAE